MVKIMYIKKTKKKNEIVAIVVTYNRASLLEECVSALLGSSYPTDILIVDNASTDDTRSVVEKFDDSIHYCNTGSNIGGAGGFNIGLKKAYEMGYQYFWLMDDDTIVNCDSLERIMNCVGLLNSEWGFISSKAIWCDGSRCFMNYHTIDGSWENDVHLFGMGMIRIKMATFVSFFVRREVVADVGLPIREYFIWGDDTEYSSRISNKYPSYYCNDSIVTHKMKNNQGTYQIADLSDVIKIERMELSIRNDICTFRRLNGCKGELSLIKNLIGRLIIVLTKKDINYRFLKIKVIIKGIFRGMFFAPQIEKVDQQVS